jgi:hypothetical protein
MKRLVGILVMSVLAISVQAQNDAVNTLVSMPMMTGSIT